MCALVFVFRSLRVTCFDASCGKPEASQWNSVRCVSRVFYNDVLQYTIRPRVRFYSFQTLEWNTTQTARELFAPCFMSVFQVSVCGFTPKGHFIACIIWREKFGRKNCVLCSKRSLARMLRSDDVAEALTFLTSLGSVSPRKTSGTQTPNAHIPNQTPPKSWKVLDWDLSYSTESWGRDMCIPPFSLYRI